MLFITIILLVNLLMETSVSFTVVVPGDPVVAHVGSTVILSCWINPPENAEALEIRWYHQDQFNNPVLHYKDGKWSDQSGGLKDGDVSLRLEKLTLQDEGSFHCYVSGDTSYDDPPDSLDLWKTRFFTVLSNLIVLICALLGLVGLILYKYRDKLRGKKPAEENREEETMEKLTEEGLVQKNKPPKNNWLIGVMKHENVGVKNKPALTPSSGFWFLCSEGQNGFYSNTDPPVKLSLTPRPERLGVLLDYDEGQLSFYNIKESKHLLTISTTFSESVLPLFNPGVGDQSPVKILDCLKPIHPVYCGLTVKSLSPVSMLSVIIALLVNLLIEISVSFTVVVPGDPVVAHVGSTVILPCWINPPENAEDLEIRWYRKDQFDNPVLHYNHGKIQDIQEESYRNRSSLMPWSDQSGGLKDGDVSLRLEKLTLQDEGSFHCYVSGDTSYDGREVALKITGQSKTTVHYHMCHIFSSKCFVVIQQLFVKNRLTLTIFFSGKYTNSLNSSGFSFSDPSDSSGPWKALFFTILICALLGLVGLILYKYRNKLTGKKPAKQIVGDVNIEELRKHADEITIDRQFVSLDLTVSEDRKTMSVGDKCNHPGEGFPYQLRAFGAQRFSSGHHYWEVELPVSPNPSETYWLIGVVKEGHFQINNRSALTPSSGYWFLCSDGPNGFYTNTEPKVKLPLTPRPERLGVLLEYVKGQLSFYNIKESKHLLTISTTFYGSVVPLFNLGANGPNGFHTNTDPPVKLSLTPRPERLGVLLDYDEGQLSFYNIKESKHLLTISTTFSESVVPLFNPVSFDVVVPGDPVVAHVGSTVILPCRINPPENAEALEIRWYPKGIQNIQEKSHRNRSSLMRWSGQSGGLKDGDVSLRLDKLTLQDEGSFICYVSGDTAYDSQEVLLNIISPSDASGPWKARFFTVLIVLICLILGLVGLILYKYKQRDKLPGKKPAEENCDVRQLSFYNVKESKHLLTISTTFSGSVVPLFNPGVGDQSTLKILHCPKPVDTFK
ncbi:Butyrophilin subfamily 1 member A1 [Labeo rohita]|uniref:Butyrophilin subfamily 1 member A1 n=1 Tax=Labeo rohita TaxID=84645 RepID=A0ABQ8MJM3_LABRO|nr:Butyrophilin subfamily 1 member A1 [Labeo rohita]